MIHQDYLVRQVMQFTQALAQVIFYRHKKQYDEALAEVQSIGQLFLGLDLGEGCTVTYSDVMAALEEKKITSEQGTSHAAELIRQKGEIHTLRNETESAGHNLRLSLHLYLDLFNKENVTHAPDYIQRIDLLLSQVDEYTLPTDILRLLFRFYDAVGRFDKAEDILFMLADKPDEKTYSQGIAYYDRLRKKTNAKLMKGGLSREEVVEGIEAFKKRF